MLYTSYIADEIEIDTQFDEIFEFDSNETESYLKQKSVIHLNCNRRSDFSNEKAENGMIKTQMRKPAIPIEIKYGSYRSYYHTY